MVTLEVLGPYVVTSHIRDSVVYEDPHGAAARPSVLRNDLFEDLRGVCRQSVLEQRECVSALERDLVRLESNGGARSLQGLREERGVAAHQRRPRDVVLAQRSLTFGGRGALSRDEVRPRVQPALGADACAPAEHPQRAGRRRAAAWLVPTPADSKICAPTPARWSTMPSRTSAVPVGCDEPVRHSAPARASPPCGDRTATSTGTSGLLVRDVGFQVRLKRSLVRA